MRRIAGISVGACAMLALNVPLAGCLRQGTAKVQGTPSRPTFVFDPKLVLRNFSLAVWEDGRWSRTWGIEKVEDAREVIREVQCGTAPKGYSEYVSPKQPALRANTLYTFGFEGGDVRGGGTFAIVEKGGAPSIVQFDNSRSFEDILKEFKKLVHKRPG